MTITILSHQKQKNGDIKLGLKITRSDGTFETFATVPAEEANTMTDATDLEAWLQAEYPSSPSWLDSMVGQTVTT